MATDMYGDFLSSIGKLNLNFDYSNLALVTIQNNRNFPAIIQQLQVQRGERVQPVQCFNDTVHLYLFGKTPLTGVISGFSLLNGGGFQSLISEYQSNLRAFQGTTFTLDVARGETVSGLMTNFTYSVDANRPVFVNFNFNFYGFEQDDTFTEGSL